MSRPTTSPVSAALVAAGVSQREIAARCGCSEQMVYQVVHGQRPNPRIREAIAEACGVSVDSLWQASNAAA